MNAKFQKYFETYEIASLYVCNTKQPSEIYALFDDKLQDLIVWAREGIGRAFYANNWMVHEKLKQSNPRLEKFEQRGIRIKDDPDCKRQKFVSKSAHFEGKALDFDVQGMTAKEVRTWLKKHANEAPHPFRVEDGVNWVHMDCRGNVKGYFFNP
jgi:hypothetical protein